MEEFGVETNEDAVKKLRAELRKPENDLHKKVKIDYEGGCVFIHASSKRSEEILKVAVIINGLAIETYCIEIDVEYVNKVRHMLMTWKRPKSQKWKVGDILFLCVMDSPLISLLIDNWNNDQFSVVDVEGILLK